VKFRRQLARGHYIVDFICLTHGLVVEVDGDQHADSAYDADRDAWLVEQGYRVLRFGNRDVLGNVEGVLETILAALQECCC
jgi:very-short-patch-repair endonuclease